MPHLKFAGPVKDRVSSFLTLNRIAIGVYARHAIGRRIAPDWDANMEIGILFCRHQFTKAMTMRDPSRMRSLFDSLQTETDDVYAVTAEPNAHPKGTWFYPKNKRTGPCILYLHGGGYAFRGGVSFRFAAMLAAHTGLRLYMPHYRLTPEHAHPAQAEDAMAAWNYLAQNIAATEMVVMGDSAGGHMALTLLQSLKRQHAAQPALCIGLCPWTDIGRRGQSLTDNDRYDLVQGWMALKFGEWLDPHGQFGRQALSPIDQDFSNTAPIFLQAGGREVLHDMIVEFAEVQRAKGARVVLDVWPDMPHNFQAYDSMTRSSTQALHKIRNAIAAHLPQ
jgi:acetyl esterase/lipase